MEPVASRSSQHSRRGNAQSYSHYHPGSAPHQGASPLKPNDIVLLEESDRYRYEYADRVLRDTVGSYQPTSSTSSLGAASVPRPDRPEKYACSVQSFRSQRTAGAGGPVGPGNYAMHHTPYAASAKRTASIDTIPAHYGALRPGGPVNLFTKDYIGLLLNWTLVGFYNSSISGLALPLFQYFLSFSQSQMTATSTLFNFGWYFKFIFGFISDNYAINRQRRKPYMFIGYTVFTGVMLAMAIIHKIAWYGPSPQEIHNANAPNEGARYLVPIIIASFAQLMVNVACEGMMVEFAHREGEYDRGRTMLWCLVFRFIGQVTGGVYTALGLNSERYGGTFAHSIPLSWFFASLGVLAIVGIFITHFLIKEEQVPSTAQSFASNIRRVWRFLEQCVTTQIMLALFVLSLAINVGVVEYSSIFTDWFHSDTLTVSLVTIFQLTGFIIAFAGLYFWFLNTNWRLLVVASYAIAVVIQLPVELLTVWDVVRSTALFLAKDWVAGIFEAVVWTIQIMAAVEGAEPGIESMSYGVFTTVPNIASALLTSSYNMIAATWSTQSTDLTLDDRRVRWHLTYEFIAKYGVRFALVFLVWFVLPRQKRHVKEIKIRGAPNLVVPIVFSVVIVLLFVAAITAALLSMFKSTMCLPFAGGSGCGK